MAVKAGRLRPIGTAGSSKGGTGEGGTGEGGTGEGGKGEGYAASLHRTGVWYRGARAPILRPCRMILFTFRRSR